MIVAIGCGCRGAGKTPPPLPLADAQAVVSWATRAPTGADWPQVVERIEPAQRRPLALELLRGSVACPDFEVHRECGDLRRVWRELPATATIDQPCLRRQLVPWALKQLTPDDVRAIAPQLATLVQLPLPEDELQAAAIAAAPDDEVRLRLVAAAVVAQDADDADDVGVDAAAAEDTLDRYDEAWIEQAAAALTTDAARLVALRTHRVGSMLLTLDPVAHRALRVAAIADDEREPAIRGGLLEQLAADRGADVTAALVRAAEDDDVELAAAAALVLAEHGDPSFLPKRPRSLDAAAHLRALRRLRATSPDDDDPRWRQWLGARVTVVRVSHSYDDQPPMAGSAPVTERVRAADLALPEELEHDDWQCEARSCAYVGHPTELRIDFATDGPTLRIERLTRHHYDGDDC